MSDLNSLVVVAAHGNEFIDHCLESLGDKYPILVVDTFSDESVKIKRTNNVRLVRMPFKGYSGAFLWAYLHHNFHNYFFMQDSMEAIEEDYLRPFIDFQPERGAVAWATLPFTVDDSEQSKYVRYLYSSVPEKMIFGPVFYTNRETLDELRDKQLLPPFPMNKDQDMASEGLWAMAFKQAGMELVSYGDYEPNEMNNGGLGIFKKRFPHRL